MLRSKVRVGQLVAGLCTLAAVVAVASAGFKFS
jgi:hypothetical protein